MIQPNKLAVGIVGSALTVELLSGCGDEPETKYCEMSPISNGQVYTGDRDVNDHDQSTWKSGTDITITEPGDATHVRAGWRLAKKQEQEAENPHYSRWLRTENEQRLAMKIGQQSVFFSVQFRAPEGSPACNQDLTATFGGKKSLKSIEDIARRDQVKLVWPRFS